MEEEIFTDDNPLSIIEMIPYRETRNYVKLIYRNYFFYQSLYPKTRCLKIPAGEDDPQRSLKFVDRNFQMC